MYLFCFFLKEVDKKWLILIRIHTVKSLNPVFDHPSLYRNFFSKNRSSFYQQPNKAETWGICPLSRPPRILWGHRKCFQGRCGPEILVAAWIWQSCLQTSLRATALLWAIKPDRNMFVLEWDLRAGQQCSLGNDGSPVQWLENKDLQLVFPNLWGTWICPGLETSNDSTPVWFDPNVLDHRSVSDHQFNQFNLSKPGWPNEPGLVPPGSPGAGSVSSHVNRRQFLHLSSSTITS